MRFYFAPMGKGLGHVGRCIPIANRLRERDADVIFSTYQEGIDYIKKERLPLIKAPPIDLQVKPDGSVDFRQTVVAPGPFLASYTLMKQVNAEIESIQSFKPDLVISDSRASPLMAAKILGIPSTCILNQFQVIIPRRQHLLRLARFADFVTLTFIGKIWTAGSRVLIPDFPQPYTISKGNLSIPKSYRKKVELIGAILPIRPDELPDKRKLRKRLKLPVDKPVIFAPISGPIKERTFLIEILRKLLLQFPEKYEVVLSFGYPNADTDPRDYGNLRIFKWVPNRFDYLKACDVVISRAGHGTLTQCICYGKPVVIIPTPGHTEQLNNAMRAKKLGVANIVNQKRLSKQVLLEKVQQILTSDTSTNVEKIQKAVLEHNGLENAVNKIIETAQESV